MFTRTVLTYVGIYTRVAFNVRTFAIDSEAVFLPSTGRTKGLLYSIFGTFCKKNFYTICQIIRSYMYKFMLVPITILFL